MSRVKLIQYLNENKGINTADYYRAEVFSKDEVKMRNNYNALIRIRSESLITGDKVSGSDDNPQYENLRLTEAGKEYLHYFDTFSASPNRFFNWCIKPIIVSIITAVIVIPVTFFVAQSTKSVEAYINDEKVKSSPPLPSLEETLPHD